MKWRRTTFGLVGRARECSWGTPSPARIVLLYLVFASIWILLSDRVAEYLVGGPASASIQTAKGLLFVSATTLLLLALIRRHVSSIVELDQELHAILESMTDAVVVVRSGEVLGANKAARTLLGLPAEGALCLPLEDLEGRVRLDDSSDDRPMRLALAGHSTEARNATVLRPDGAEVPVSVSASAVLLGGKAAVPLAVGVLRDVTRLRGLERVRDDFLATAAHELKTPVAALKGYVQLLERWAPESASPRELGAYQAIDRQCDRLTHLVQEMLEVSRLQATPPELRRRTFDLGELAGRMMKRMKAAGPNHRLVLDAEPGVEVLADPQRIEQVLANLIGNAIRFSPDGEEIEVRVRACEGEAHIAVVDHGIGIPSDRTGRLFDRFYQAHLGTDYHHLVGLGLGLHLSREVVRRHGGRIWFETEEGKGSTFHVSLPMTGGADGKRKQAGAGHR